MGRTVESIVGKKWQSLVPIDLVVSRSERSNEILRTGQPICFEDYRDPTAGRKSLMDLNKALDSILLLCKSDFRGKRITVMRDYAERLPQIHAVFDQIKQVVLNMLINAADACRQRGGEIVVSTRQEDENTVAVAIKDNGIGINPADMERIFQPFYTTKSEVKGTGLGLSVSYGIVQNHHGEIRVESHPGEGSTFTVLLQICDTDVASYDCSGRASQRSSPLHKSSLSCGQRS
ncbi:MAG: sensor histidine kinase [Desulfopila sp.]